MIVNVRGIFLFIFLGVNCIVVKVGVKSGIRFLYIFLVYNNYSFLKCNNSIIYFGYSNNRLNSIKMYE